MKLFITIFLGCFFLTMFGSITSADAQFWKRNSKNGGSANIKINFINEDINFGVVRLGELPDQQLEFTNNSNFPIIIKSFTRACGVTIPEYSSKVIEPGETGYIKLMLNPRDIRGRFERTMEIVFINANNNEEYSTQTIQVRGSVVRTLGS